MNNIEKYFFKILDIYKNEFFSNREKLFLFFKLNKELFNLFVLNDIASFTDYALFYHVLQNASISKELQVQLISCRRYILHIKKKVNFEPASYFVDNYMQVLVKIVSFITSTSIPKELLTIIQNIKNNHKTNETIAQNASDLEIDLANKAPQCANENLKKIVLTYINKISYKDKTILLCQDYEDKKYAILIDKSKYEHFRPGWLYCNMCFTNLQPISPITLELNAKCDIYKNAIFYETTHNSQLIIESNYLIDVTDITDCFASKQQLPVIPVISKFLNRTTGLEAFTGNIVNSFFDELLENIEINFDTALNNAIEKKPLQLLAIVKQNPNYQNDINVFFSIHRKEWYDYFNNLRNIILQNFHIIKSENHTKINDNALNINDLPSFSVEPSFISNIYGMQGRLDLLIERKNKENTTSIDIIELKSNKAPIKNISAYIGLSDRRKLYLPLWLSHYIQIVCYNMLLENKFSTEKFVKGFSSILYSKPSEINPLRSVMDNAFVQNQIIIMRNWIVRYMRELAIGNISILTDITKEQINDFPVYLQSDIKELLVTFNNLSQLEKSYFTYQTMFVVKEMFAQKTGIYSDLSHSEGNNYGFASLWMLNFEDKLSQHSIIPDLTVDYDGSNFSNMHIKFNTDNSAQTHNYSTNFRKNDICIVYPAPFPSAEQSDIEASVPVYDQIFRGKIVEINSEYIIASLRNKLNKEKFINTNRWNLEVDYMEVVSRYLLASVSNFTFSQFANKQHILGTAAPEFVVYDNIQKTVDNIQNLSPEQKIILNKALAAKNYYLIQGPPGTGKTSFILRYLAQVLFSCTQENILLLAYTNRAVDEICGSIKKITNDIQHFDFIRLGNKDSSEHTDKLLSNCSIEVLPEKVNKCRCFVATVATANASPELFQIKDFDTIIIDEAAQILESSIIGLLSKSSRFIMIGDEKQLPPISVTKDKYLKVDNELLNSVDIHYLEDSLFERLLRICVKNNYPAFSLLSMQSRMSPQIMQLANDLFYNNQLVRNDKIAVSPLNLFDSERDCFYIDTPIDRNSKINYFQVDIILQLIDHVKQAYRADFNEDITNSTIGIISPWRTQCNAIINSISKEDKDLIAVDTVERFQGAERDIIIFSVSANSLYLLDLISNSKLIHNIEIDRKLNVAITRAKKKFILLGNYELLSQNHIYKHLISKLQQGRALDHICATAASHACASSVLEWNDCLKTK